MTVLHILDHSMPILSGYATRSQQIALAQRRSGVRPVLLTSARHTSTGATELVDGVLHYRTPAARRGTGRLSYRRELQMMIRLAGRISQVVRAEGADILHAHSPVLNGLPALWVGRRLGLPVVYEARAFWEDAAVDHGATREGAVRYRLSRGLETFLFKRADRVVTIAEAMRREIVQRGVEPRRVTVVPNGIDPERLRPTPPSPRLAARLGLAGRPVLGFIGSFYRYEGLRFLVETLPALRARMPGLHLLLVGGGEEEPMLRAMARCADGALVVAGQVPYARVPDYYALMDVFVCPRRRMRLTELVTPLKPLEAMAMGRPVLASDVGGLTELIRHEVTGLLFPAESTEAFVAEALRIAGDRSLRDRLAEAARDHVERERAWKYLVIRYLDLYRSLHSNGAASTGSVPLDP